MNRSQWQTVRVGDLVTSKKLVINDGYRVTNRELGPVGIPFVRGGDIGDGSITTEVTDHIRPEFQDRVTTKLTQPGDVAFISKGTVGRVGYLQPGQPAVVFAPQVCYYRVLDTSSLDSRFLFYLLKGSAFQANLDAVKTHGSMVADYVSLSDQRHFRLTVPPVQDQRAIGRILGSLDDKIDLNRRMNETLEAMARAVFRSWFVDFDPVRAKADGRTPAGMDDATAALFPDRFADSPLGPIPNGWGTTTISDVTEGLFDGPHATPPEADKGAVFLGIKNLTGTQIDLCDIRHIAETDWPRWTKRVTPRGGDIVFSYEAALGLFALIPPDLRCCLGRRLALVRPDPTLSVPHFLFHTFTGGPFQDLLVRRTVSGSTVDRIPLLDFPSFAIAWPNLLLIQKFELFATHLWQRIHTNQSQILTLAALRDALLPRLLSGELRVPEAEAIAEAAT